MSFWDQFWPQFWGGLASGATLALVTGLITFIVRKRIFRALERNLGIAKEASTDQPLK
jgi:hypothetical protein